MLTKALKGKRKKIVSFNSDPLYALDNRMKRDYVGMMYDKVFRGPYRNDTFYRYWLLYRCYIRGNKKKKGPKKIDRYEYMYGLEEKYHHYEPHDNFKHFFE